MDIIGIYDEDFQQVFLDTKVLKASVNDQSQVFFHPLENGSKTVDHIITNPIEISLVIILASVDYKNTYKSLKKLKDESTSLTIQTRTDVYPDMLIVALPYEEDATVFDGIQLAVSLRQVKIGTTEDVINPRYSKDATKQRNGNVQGEEVSGAKRNSILSGLLG